MLMILKGYPKYPQDTYLQMITVNKDIEVK